MWKYTKQKQMLHLNKQAQGCYFLCSLVLGSKKRFDDWKWFTKAVQVFWNLSEKTRLMNLICLLDFFGKSMAEILIKIKILFTL